MTKYFIVMQTGSNINDLKIVQSSSNIKQAIEMRNIYKEQTKNCNFFITQLIIKGETKNGKRPQRTFAD